jgi:hypothetical protein
MEDSETILANESIYDFAVKSFPMTPRMTQELGFTINQFDYGSNELKSIVKLTSVDDDGD